MPTIEQPARLRVRELREARGWRREKLAVESGVSYPTLSRIEAGQLPHLSTLIQIANGLGVSLDELIDLTPSPNQG
jgi:transcriptional regulator with XRE-family HTH domain